MMNLKKKGLLLPNISELDSDLEPQILLGTYVDVDGVVAYFDAAANISGSASDGVAFVRVFSDNGVPTAEYTNEVPIYDVYRKGYYNPDNKRYILQFDKAGSTYLNKRILETEAYTRELKTDVVDATTMSTTDLNVTGTLLDKNGNEVTAMRAEYQEGSVSGQVSGGYWSGNLTLTFSNPVQGLASVVVHSYRSTSSPVTCDITDVNINGNDVTFALRMYYGTNGTTVTAKLQVTAFTD